MNPEATIPDFLKVLPGASRTVVERVEGERTFLWWPGARADLHGEWTAEELRQIAAMMEAANHDEPENR